IGASCISIVREDMPSFYPRLPDFQAIRRKMDPAGRFLNDHLRTFSRDEPIVRAPSRSYSTEHHTQIVCGHLDDRRNRESDGLRGRCDRCEVSQTPGRVAIAKASVERLVARGGCESFAFVWAIEIERRRRRKDRRRAPDQSE